jgi:hypothetical protein
MTPPMLEYTHSRQVGSQRPEVVEHQECEMKTINMTTGHVEGGTKFFTNQFMPLAARSLRIYL